MPAPTYPLVPHHSQQPTSIRRIYIQNLTDLLHVCLLRGDRDRATRAWAILIRCREVDWRSRWYWGLQCLNAAAAAEGQITSTSQSSEQYAGRDAEKWLRGVRISAREAEKPALLHALVLHLVKHDRHRAALDELDTYLTSYPYLLSGPLHTYAGLLAFYLAQPPSLRSAAPGAPSGPKGDTSRATSRHASPQSSPTSASSRSTPVPTQRPMHTEPVNATFIKQARAYFNKALNLDPSDEVATQFLDIIDRPEGMEAFDSDVERSRRTASHSVSGKSGDAADHTDSDIESSSQLSDAERKDDDKEDAGKSDAERTDGSETDNDSQESLRQLDSHSDEYDLE